MATKLNTQQREINQLQAYQARRQEQAVQQFGRQFGNDIMALTPRQVRRIRRQRQRLQAQRSRLQRTDKAKS